MNDTDTRARDKTRPGVTHNNICHNFIHIYVDFFIAETEVVFDAHQFYAQPHHTFLAKKVPKKYLP